jgi:hypothetical protein
VSCSQSVSQSVKRKVGLCDMDASLGVSQLWDIRQPVRKLAEDIVKIHYQETTSEGIEDFIYCSYSDL